MAAAAAGGAVVESAATMTAALIELRHRLLRGDYTPLPLYGKVPPAYGKNNPRGGLGQWQKLENVSYDQIKMWAKSWPDAINTGVLTRLTPALDLDLLNEPAAVAAEDFVREHYEEGGYILTRIGRAPKRAILFRTQEPFAKIVANLVAPNGTAEKIEFLADGQQVVVDGIHPETQRPYSWHGGSPDKIAQEQLPYIREAEAQALVAGLVDLLVRDFGYRKTVDRPRKQTEERGDSAGSGGAADWQYLIDRILAGEALHDSLRDLAAKLIKSGMNEGAVVNHLRSLMDTSSAPHDARWQDRRAEIPRLVDSAAEKYREPPAEPGETAPPEQNKADDCLAMLDVPAWDGVPVPARCWAVRDRIIRRAVTLLSGEGGVGKSILILQLCCAHCLDRDWFGQLAEPGPVIYLNAEDDDRELHFRLEAIRAHLGIAFAALKDLHLVPLAGEDALLGVPDRSGIIRPTPLFERLLRTAARIKPVLIALDTAADMFGGNENDRSQVRQFIGLLRRLAITGNAAVLLASHPSLSGINSDSGLSGSTGWHNSVRSRLFFKASETDDEARSDQRELIVRKNNYGPTGEIVRMVWRGGVFVPVSTPSSFERAAADQKVENLFLQLFDRLTDQGQTLNHHPASPTYAPRRFAKLRDANKTPEAAFAGAMQRLMDAGTIRVETYGRPSRPSSRLVRA
jgi:RecA-family ATPase